MVVPQFGFSIGDFLAVIDTVRKVCKAVKDQGGAATEYQRLMQNLESLQLILQHLEGLESTEANRSLIQAIQAQAHQALKPVHDCIVSVSKYKKQLGNAIHGGKLVGHARKTQWALTVGGELAKLQSSLSMDIERINLLIGVNQLGALSRIEALLTSQSFCAASQPITLEAPLSQIGSRDVDGLQSRCSRWPRNISWHLSPPTSSDIQQLLVQDLYPILDLVNTQPADKTFTLSNFRYTVDELRCNTRNNTPQHRSPQSIGTSLSKFSSSKLINFKKQIVALYLIMVKLCGQLLQNFLLLPQVVFLLKAAHHSLIRAPAILLGNSISFEDCFGQTRFLDYAYFRHWEVFKAMIEVEFKGKPGETLVMQKLYRIVDNNGKIVTPLQWKTSLSTGSFVAMSMLMRNLRVRNNLCPKPACEGEGRPGPVCQGSLQCNKCELRFTPVKRDDVYGIGLQRRWMPLRDRKPLSLDLDEERIDSSQTSMPLSKLYNGNKSQDTNQHSPPLRRIHSALSYKEVETDQHTQLKISGCKTDSKYNTQLAEVRLKKAKIEARKRECREITYFKRIHIPESTHALSLWQVVMIISLMRSWSRRRLPWYDILSIERAHSVDLTTSSEYMNSGSNRPRPPNLSRSMLNVWLQQDLFHERIALYMGERDFRWK